MSGSQFLNTRNGCAKLAQPLIKIHRTRFGSHFKARPTSPLLILSARTASLKLKLIGSLNYRKLHGPTQAKSLSETTKTCERRSTMLRIKQHWYVTLCKLLLSNFSSSFRSVNFIAVIRAPEVNTSPKSLLCMSARSWTGFANSQRTQTFARYLNGTRSVSTSSRMGKRHGCGMMWTAEVIGGTSRYSHHISIYIYSSFYYLG